MRIQVDEITKDVSLIVSDFADEDEVEESKMFWENQISNLKQVLGSAWWSIQTEILYLLLTLAFLFLIAAFPMEMHFLKR